MNTGLFVLIASFLWAALAAITCAIASTKHRNAVGWLAIGAIYPLLGMILAIVLPPNPVPDVHEADAASRMWWRGATGS